MTNAFALHVIPLVTIIGISVAFFCVCDFFSSPLSLSLSFCAFPAHHCVVWAKKSPVDQRQSSPSVQSHSNRKSQETRYPVFPAVSQSDAEPLVEFITIL